MVSRISKSRRDGVDDGRRSGLIRIAHAEVDEIGTATSRVCLELVQPREDVLRQVRQSTARNELRRTGRLDIGEFVGSRNGGHLEHSEGRQRARRAAARKVSW